MYDKVNKKTGKQVPIVAPFPPNNAYFIGKHEDDKLLCYHTTEGKYVVISYNFSSAKLLQNVLDVDIYSIKTVEYEVNEIKGENPSGVPSINTDMSWQD